MYQEIVLVRKFLRISTPYSFQLAHWSGIHQDCVKCAHCRWRVAHGGPQRGENAQQCCCCDNEEVFLLLPAKHKFLQFLRSKIFKSQLQIYNNSNLRAGSTSLQQSHTLETQDTTPGKRLCSQNLTFFNWKKAKWFNASENTKTAERTKCFFMFSHLTLTKHHHLDILIWYFSGW